MRTKEEILEDRRENIPQTPAHGNITNYQAELLLEVLIDLRDILDSIHTRLKEIDESIYRAT